MSKSTSLFDKIENVAKQSLATIVGVPAQIGTQLANSSFALASDIVDNSGAPDEVKASINNNLKKVHKKIPKSKREMSRKTETAALGFVETVQPEVMTKAFYPLLVSLINDKKVPNEYSEFNKAAAKTDTKACLVIIEEYKQALLQYYSGGKKPEDRTSLQGASFAAKKQLEIYLAKTCLKLNLPEDAFEDLARDHFLWLVRDQGVDLAIKSSKTLAKLAIAEVIMVLDFADIVRFAVRDIKSREYLKILLDNIFYGGKALSGMSPEQRAASGVPQIRWTKQGKITTYKGTKGKEKTMPKNVSEGIMDFFKKDKIQTAEEFFEVDRMGSKGAKGLIIKMLDVMTPDANIEFKGTGQGQADAVSYVQDYVKNSFLGKIDSESTRGDNENADFAKYMDSAAWGENINFDTLIEAAKELYEHAGDFFDETQAGEDTESRQQTLVTLGVNTIPAVLLFYCLKYLGSSLYKMRKRYNSKRMAKPMSENKILENYIKENNFLTNIREEEVDAQVESDDSLGQMVADQVNAALNSLPDDNPSKNRETGLQMIAQIKQMLQTPEVVGGMIEAEVQKMVDQMR